MTSQQYIHLFRHDVAIHSYSHEGFYMHDPVLTTDGVKSAKEVLEHPKKRFNKPTLVLISPLQRCIQTALYAFHPEWNKKAAEFFKDGLPRFVIMPQLQEMSQQPCDTCHSLEFLKEKYGKEVEFPNEWFTNNDWLVKRGTDYADDNWLAGKRAEFVRQYIKGLPDREVVVVTHGDFIHYLVNRWDWFGHESKFGRLELGDVATMVIHDLDDSKTQLQREIPPWTIP